LNSGTPRGMLTPTRLALLPARAIPALCRSGRGSRSELPRYSIYLGMDLRRIVNKSGITLAGVFLFVPAIVSFSQQQKTRSQGDGTSRSGGQQVFASNCSGCHGLDGTGTQRAP